MFWPKRDANNEVKSHDPNCFITIQFSLSVAEVQMPDFGCFVILPLIILEIGLWIFEEIKGENAKPIGN